jgi:hypothetical protein
MRKTHSIIALSTGSTQRPLINKLETIQEHQRRCQPVDEKHLPSVESDSSLVEQAVEVMDECTSHADVHVEEWVISNTSMARFTEITWHISDSKPATGRVKLFLAYVN